MKYGIWNVSKPKTESVNALVSGGYAPLTAMVLSSRGIQNPREAHACLDCSAALPDPFLMRDMDKAARRVRLAMDQGEKIAVFGDYDVEHLLRPVDTMFASHEKLCLNEKQARLVKNGNAFASDCPDGTYRVYAPDGEFLALCRAESGKVSTIKSFFEV